MSLRTVSRSEFARFLGVSPAAVTKRCKGQLGPACVDDRIDVDHPAAVEYAASKGKVWPPRGARKKSHAKKKAKRAKKAARPAPRKKREPSTEVELADDLREYGEMTLNAIIEKHGTARRWKDLLEARAKIAAIMQRELEMSESRGELIKREKVRTHVYGLVDAALRRLLSDAAKTVAQRLFVSCRAGEPLEEGERIAKEIIASHIRLLKQDVGGVLDGS